MAKKEEQKKAKLPEYFDYNRVKEETQDRLKCNFSIDYGCGLDVMAKDFTGREGRKAFLYMLHEMFIERNARADITINGLGHYVAEVVDVEVVKDDDKKFRPAVKILVISDYEEGNEFLAKQFDHTTRVYYKGGWGNCLIDAVDSIVGEMYDCMESAFRYDYESLPEDKRV